MANAHDWKEPEANVDTGSFIFFIKGLFVCCVWFAFIICTINFIISCAAEPYRETNALNVLYFIAGLIITSTLIIVFQFGKLNNTLKEIKKAIEDKQPVIIQKKVVAPEQDKK